MEDKKTPEKVFSTSMENPNLDDRPAALRIMRIGYIKRKSVGRDPAFSESIDSTPSDGLASIPTKVTSYLRKGKDSLPNKSRKIRSSYNHNWFTFWTTASITISVVALILKLSYYHLFFPIVIFYLAFMLIGPILALISFFKIMSFLLRNRQESEKTILAIQLLISILPFIMLFHPDIGLMGTVFQPSYGFDISDTILGW